MRILAGIVIALASAAAIASPDTDFAARCTAAGVVACYPLDTESQLASQGSMQMAGDGTRQGYIDNITKVSGDGSLRFKLRAGNSARNIGGAWSASLGQNFGAGSTMYVQFRVRYSPAVVTNNNNIWRSSLKLTNIHGPSSTCQNSEFTMITSPSSAGRLMIESYHNCGFGFPTNVSTNALLSACGGGDCLLQQGSSLVDGPNVGYNCHYQNQFSGSGNGNGCLRIEPNVWYTVYQRLGLGTYGGSNTTYDAWIQREGGPMLQFHRVAGIQWGGGDTTFRLIRLETYMTEILGAASTDSYIWYDELIVSTQPIAAPIGVPPMQPTGVTVN